MNYDVTGKVSKVYKKWYKIYEPYYVKLEGYPNEFNIHEDHFLNIKVGDTIHITRERLDNGLIEFNVTHIKT